MLNTIHTAGKNEFTIKPAVKSRSVSERSVALTVRPATRPSMARPTMPTQKHRLANDDFFGRRLTNATTRATIPAAKGRNDSRVTGPSMGKARPPLLAAQPVNEQE